jgi:hypothetical protein
MLLRCESLEPPMSQLGHERRFRAVREMSAYHLANETAHDRKPCGKIKNAETVTNP